MFKSWRTQVRNWRRSLTSTSISEAVTPLLLSQCRIHLSDIYHLDILYYGKLCKSSLAHLGDEELFLFLFLTQLGQYLTFVDPYLHPDAAVGGVRLLLRVIDVSPQGL